MHKKVLQILFILLLTVTQTACLSSSSIKKLVEDGNQLLSNGKVALAIEKYDEAIQRDSSDFLVYFKRATAYISLGKVYLALNDLEEILRLKPDFDVAQIQKARLLSKLGNWQEAAKTIKPLSSGRDMLSQIKTTEKLAIQAKSDLDNKKWEACMAKISQVVSVASLNPHYRRIRAICNIHLKNYEQAITDLTNALAHQSGMVQDYVLLADLLFICKLDMDRSLTYLRKFLYLDPEEKTIKTKLKFLRSLKATFDKINDNFEKKYWKRVINDLEDSWQDIGFASKAAEYIEHSEIGNVHPTLESHINFFYCVAYAETSNYGKARKHCDKSQDHYSHDLLHQLAVAKVLIGEEKYEEASRLLRKLNEESRGDKRIIELYEKAQKLFKTASLKNYYKILGVPKTASEKEIKKAYRKMTLLYHPDKYKGDMTAEQVQAKMSDINEAWEVLSNREKREQYDNGVDPNNPQAQFQDGGGGGAFYGSPFGAGGFPFNFDNDNFFQQFQRAGSRGNRGGFQFQFY